MVEACRIFLSHFELRAKYCIEQLTLPGTRATKVEQCWSMFLELWVCNVQVNGALYYCILLFESL